MTTYIIQVNRTVHENFEVISDGSKTKEELEKEIRENISNGKHDYNWDEEFISEPTFEFEQIGEK